MNNGRAFFFLGAIVAAAAGTGEKTAGRKRRSRRPRGCAARGHATDRTWCPGITPREPPLAEGTGGPPQPRRPSGGILEWTFVRSGRGGGGTPPGSPAERGAPRLRRFHPNEPMRDGKQLRLEFHRGGDRNLRLAWETSPDGPLGINSQGEMTLDDPSRKRWSPARPWKETNARARGGDARRHSHLIVVDPAPPRYVVVSRHHLPAGKADLAMLAYETEIIWTSFPWPGVPVWLEVVFLAALVAIAAVITFVTWRLTRRKNPPPMHPSVRP